MKCGFTGTRNGCTDRQLQALKLLMYGLEEWRGELEAAHGSCLGADSQFHEICINEGIPVDLYPGFPKGNPSDLSNRATLSGARTVFPADNFLARNDKIVQWADLIIGCPPSDLSSMRGGSYYTIRKAQQEGVQTIVLFP